jgi:hexulose-6-phosphate isomerase
MKKSINIWSFNPALSLPEKFALAQDAGFPAIEVELAETGPVSLASTAADLSEVLRQAGDHGLTLSGLACGLYWGANAASADAANRQKAADILNKQIEVAHGLNLDAILVVPGAVGVDFIPDCEIVPYEHVWERATALIAEALPAAEAAGVQICVENVWNKFLLSPREMKAFVAQFDSPFVRCYLDVGNTLLNGYPEDWIRTLAGHIGRVHFKDFKRPVGTVDGFCELLAGDVNWPQVVAALRETGYDNWIAAEMIPPVPMYKHAPDVIIYNTSRAMDAIFALA